MALSQVKYHKEGNQENSFFINEFLIDINMYSYLDMMQKEADWVHLFWHFVKKGSAEKLIQDLICWPKPRDHTIRRWHIFPRIMQ